MSQPDRVAAAAVISHHQHLAASLQWRVADLIKAAESGGLRGTWRVRDALVAWLSEELLPHARAEEAVLYPVAARQPGAKLLIDAMLGEHQALIALVTELTDTPSPVSAAATARALQAVFAVHVAKENDLVVPLLVEAAEVSLAGLLDGMHDLIGGVPDQVRGTGTAGGCGGSACGCGGDSAAATTATVEALSIDPRLDVRDLPHGQRHARVLAELDALPAESALILVAPHAPLPLLAEIDARYLGRIAAQWLQDGPDVWQIRLQRTAT